MIKLINGQYEEITESELLNMQTGRAEYEASERTRPLTTEEVTAMLIRQQINTLTVDDQTALRMLEFYPEWAAGTSYAAGDRLVYNGYLYKVLQAHTSQETWLPGTGTESLYTRIDEAHDGTKYDPIPYDGNMALESGKYYTQSGMTYLCSRDTVNPVYNALSELVGIYVEAVNG